MRQVVLSVFYHRNAAGIQVITSHPTTTWRLTGRVYTRPKGIQAPKMAASPVVGSDLFARQLMWSVSPPVLSNYHSVC